MATAREVAGQELLAESAQRTCGKKKTVRNGASEKQKIDGERVRQLKHLLRKKRPVVRSNKTPKPKPTMSNAKLRDLRRDIEHNWQIVDGGETVPIKRAQNESDSLETWRDGAPARGSESESRFEEVTNAC